VSLDVLATGYPSFDYILPVSHSPKVGETALLQEIADDRSASYGGCGVNVATALSKLGFKTGVAMILGDDQVGTLYRSRLRALRIDDQNVITLSNSKTSRSYLYRSPDGEYQNFFFAGAADQWRGILRLANLSNTRYTLVTVGPYEYNRQFVQQSKQANVPLVWQLKPDIYAYPRDAMQNFTSASTYILMNHIEADFVLGALGKTSPAQLVEGVTKAVVVTQGARGCEVYSADGKMEIPAATPREVVDTTGAGDGFTAGFLGGVLKGYDLRASSQMGSVVASFVLENVGCQTNLPTWEQMRDRYQKNFEALEVK
jgi:nucleoside kinase